MRLPLRKLQTREATRGRSLIVALFFCLSWTLVGRAVPQKFDSANAMGPEKGSAPAKSVEELATIARRSVVVIAHYNRAGKEDGVGAGFVVSSNGLVATSLHVIGEARPIRIRFHDGREYEVIEVHAWDRKLDLALVRIAAEHLQPLPLGDSDRLDQGTPVVAMGNPLGLEFSIVQGVVSAKRAFEGVELIQLAMPIEPGNSGGPLLDRQGHVHGLLNLKSSLTANLGFATPVNALKKLLDHPNPVAMNRWLTIGALKTNEWKPLLGAQWRQKAGSIQVEGLGHGFGGRSLCLYQKEVPPIPYEVEVLVRLDDESGAAGLIFDSDGDERHYGFYPTAGQMRLTRFDGPSVFTWTILQDVKTPHYHRGDWNRIKVRREKERLLCYVNGHLVITSTDRNLPDGQVGLAKFRDTRAQFKNFTLAVQIEEEGETIPTPEMERQILGKLDRVEAKSQHDLVAALQSLGHDASPVLIARATSLEKEAAQLRQVVQALHHRMVEKRLVQILNQPEEKADLFAAALWVAKLDNPDLNFKDYEQQLEDMAKDLRDRLTPAASSQERLDALTNYLFAENGFHGSRSDYYDRANSYLSDVLDDREGIPITLSILFLELAHRVGLTNVAGASLPGHFAVRYLAPSGEDRLIDVFAGGQSLSRAEAEELAADQGVALNEQHLAPARKKDIVVRMLHNLLGIAQRSGSPADVMRYLDVLIALQPDDARERGLRALLRVQNDDVPGAREDLKWLLDHEPVGVDLKRIAELYESLAE